MESRSDLSAERTFDEAELQKEAERIEPLLAEIEALASPRVRELARELVQCLLDYHGGALERMVDSAEASGDPGRALLAAWAGDALVASALVLHGLHPAPLEDRVRAALEKVRPTLKGHGGDAELVRVEDGKAVLRLVGACHSCPSSQATLKHTVEAAVLAEAPELTAIELEGQCPA